MMKFAFISRHTPTKEQHAIAALKGIELIHVGDMDAFTADFTTLPKVVGVVVVHPAAAMKAAAHHYLVGVFENANRAAEGEKPTFEAHALHVYQTNGFELKWGID